MEFRILGPLEAWDEGRSSRWAVPSHVRCSRCSSSTPTRSCPPTG